MASNYKRKSEVFIAVFILILVLIPALFFLYTKYQGKDITVPFIFSGASPSPTQDPNESTTVELQKGVETTFPNTQIQAVLVENSVPGPQCADCVTLTRIQVSSQGNTQTLEYSCGGFTGRCTTSQDAYGYTIEILKNQTTDSVEVKVTHQ